MQGAQVQTPPRRSTTASFTAKTARLQPGFRCGRWDLRSTKTWQARGQLYNPRSLFNTPTKKRKRSPQPSVNSSTAENDCPYPMPSSGLNGGQCNNPYDPFNDDEDDLLDLHMVNLLTTSNPTKQPQEDHDDDGEGDSDDEGEGDGRVECK